MRRWSRPSTDLISAGKLVFVYLVRAVKLETDYAKQTTNGSPLDFISVDILVVCFYSPGRSNWKVITQKKNRLEINLRSESLGMHWTLKSGFRESSESAFSFTDCIRHPNVTIYGNNSKRIRRIYLLREVCFPLFLFKLYVQNLLRSVMSK